MNTEDVLTALRTVQDPELRRSIVDLGMVRDIVFDDERVAVRLVLTTAGCPLKNRIRSETEAALQPLAGDRRIEVTMDAMTAEEREQLAGKLASQPETSRTPFGPGSLTTRDRRREWQGRRRQVDRDRQPRGRARPAGPGGRTDRRRRVRARRSRSCSAWVASSPRRPTAGSSRRSGTGSRSSPWASSCTTTSPWCGAGPCSAKPWSSSWATWPGAAPTTCCSTSPPAPATWPSRSPR